MELTRREAWDEVVKLEASLTRIAKETQAARQRLKDLMDYIRNTPLTTEQTPEIQSPTEKTVQETDIALESQNRDTH